MTAYGSAVGGALTLAMGLKSYFAKQQVNLSEIRYVRYGIPGEPDATAHGASRCGRCCKRHQHSDDATEVSARNVLRETWKAACCHDARDNDEGSEGILF